ncbi:MAG: EamA family transporter [Spirulinaceae cyanobacterium SM2_1_0]|nr:EamA family transporter [Spirulinaceae cyanobacterium SM2_1_0]
MGPQENPTNGNAEELGVASNSLKALTEELEHLKGSLLAQLSQEIEQLQARKLRLMAETEDLERQRREQLAQQQEIARQLAPALAEEVQLVLRQRLHDQGLATSDGSLDQYGDRARRLISSLDSTLNATFRTLEQDLSSYQSSLSQQLGQMYNLEQQGEVILEALVGRLKDELRLETPPLPAPTPPTPIGFTGNHTRPQLPEAERENPASIVAPPSRPTLVPPSLPIPPPALAPEPTPEPKTPPPRRPTATKIQLGFLLVLFSSLALSFQNVVISIILNQSSVLGLFETGGYISPGFGNALLILFMRMVVVVPTMALLAQVLYPTSWQDIRRFLGNGTITSFAKVIACGFFLFASSALIYMALGLLSPGVALTLFFVFPIVTVLLSWVFFGERPSTIRSLASVTVFFGVVLIAAPASGTVAGLDPWGITTALGAGITFALHVLLIQGCTRELHPVPFSVINFVVILGFSALSLVLPLPGASLDVDPAMWPNLLVSSLVLGALTLLSYLANNIGISYIGAARASIFGATGPALTSILAWIIIGRSLVGLQVLGMVVVTVGVFGQNLERFYKKKPKPKPPNGRQPPANGNGRRRSR